MSRTSTEASAWCVPGKNCAFVTRVREGGHTEFNHLILGLANSGGDTSLRRDAGVLGTVPYEGALSLTGR